MSETATAELVVSSHHGAPILSPVMDVETAKQNLRKFQQFVSEYMKEGEDYGTIPGTPKPTLYKPGADKLCELYGLADKYVILDKTVNFDTGLFDYEIECQLVRRGDEALVATGLGSCSSYEGRYRWRDMQRSCPACAGQFIIKGKQEYGGGWVCFKKKGGCGAKFSDGDQAIESQPIGKIQNADIVDMKNTVLKMAKKRAKIDATLAATRSSGVFTQDMEDISGNYHDEADADYETAAAHNTKTVTLQCDVCRKPIVGVDVVGEGKLTADQLLARGRKAFDKDLCFPCQCKQKPSERVIDAKPPLAPTEPVQSADIEYGMNGNYKTAQGTIGHFYKAEGKKPFAFGLAGDTRNYGVWDKAIAAEVEKRGKGAPIYFSFDENEKGFRNLVMLLDAA